MDYYVVVDTKIDRLIERVKEYKEKGYTCAGGISITDVAGMLLYAQAVEKNQ